ncbi:alkaline phosphatase family protein [Leptothoe spongobia]|uniref:Alkaline phosphatase family protein n=1 Tax=Leptothoe spongobia TAU-MAC 1115 TaxID=1967444 RepID=A0A947DEM5_9CYAN|nr:alkaline phosphatase family protein [Leptothoe spongobia]MBT9315712.1 alkaline phosphatase family protein [Leptothoe spongobia TAU-MAC 1115]
MLNTKSIAAVNSATFLGTLQRPLYGHYCFSEIPGTISKLLDTPQQSGLPDDVFGPTGYPQPKHVVLFLIDAFGWNLFNRAAQENLPGISRFIDQGVVSKLSTLFPSTTAAHVHCLNTGLLPQQSQVFEWRQAWPSLNRVISPLIFSKGEDAGGRHPKKSHTLLEADIQPEDVFPPSTFHQRLIDQGIDVIEYLPKAYVDGCYSLAVNPMIQRRGYSSLEKGLHDLQAILNAATRQQYVKFYLPDIDSLSHDHGYTSDIVWNRVKEVFATLENLLFSNLNDHQNIAILLTADHGQVVIDAAATVYLDEEIPELMPMLAHSQDGAPLFPCGSSRDVFLQVKPEYVDQALTLLKQRLAGVAQVLLIQDVADTLFGESPSQEFLNVVGQIVILPEDSNTVFFAGPDGHYKGQQRGTHGGLTPSEAQIPFAYLTSRHSNESNDYLRPANLFHQTTP